MKVFYPFLIVLAISGCGTGVEKPPVNPNPHSKPATTINSSSGKQNKIIKPSDCSVTAPPDSLSVDVFYRKYCDANGIPVLSSENVSDRTLQWVTYQARLMLEIAPEIVEAMRKGKTRIAIMSSGEVTTDIPEHSDLNAMFPGTNWNTRARGLAATSVRPVSSAAEENVLCSPNDHYRGENIFIHEFSHTIHIMGIQPVDPAFPQRLQAIYDAAIRAGLWKQTYAASNATEYWAEGVQSWFNANLESDPPSGIHNHVNTRAELAKYDPALYQLISKYFTEKTIPLCPSGRS